MAWSYEEREEGVAVAVTVGVDANEDVVGKGRGWGRKVAWGVWKGFKAEAWG